MVWLPTVKLEVLKLAVVVPPVVLKVPWPMLVAPSEKKVIVTRSSFRSLCAQEIPTACNVCVPIATVSGLTRCCRGIAFPRSSPIQNRYT